jgi:hypothetical protein
MKTSQGPTAPDAPEILELLEDGPYWVCAIILLYAVVRVMVKRRREVVR